MQTAIQDLLPDNHCFGCGPGNAHGLRIKSFWSGVPGETICEFRAAPHHNAGPVGVLNGGIIATVMDCHSIVTAIAQAYRDEGREPGTGDIIWYVTGDFHLQYLAPAALLEPVIVTARVTETAGRRSVVRCELRSGNTLCTTAEMLAVRVPPEWNREQ